MDWAALQYLVIVLRVLENKLSYSLFYCISHLVRLTQDLKKTQRNLLRCATHSVCPLLRCLQTEGVGGEKQWSGPACFRCVEKWVSLGNLSSSFQLMPPPGCSDGEIVGIPPKCALTMFQHGLCCCIITAFIFIFDFLPSFLSVSSWKCRLSYYVMHSYLSLNTIACSCAVGEKPCFLVRGFNPFSHM